MNPRTALKPFLPEPQALQPHRCPGLSQQEPLPSPSVPLCRSKQIESACFSGTAAFMEVRIQSVVVEFILNHVDVLFSSKLSSVIRDGAGACSLLLHLGRNGSTWWVSEPPLGH